VRPDRPVRRRHRRLDLTARPARTARPGTAPEPPCRWGYLGNALVLPAWRSQGIGTALLAALLDHARAEHFSRIVLSPSERSMAFYQRAGFAPATSLLLTELDP
jgi:GNAT superfamily N-acetyltransferase